MTGNKKVLCKTCNKMFHKCDHCDYESNQMYNIRRHVKNKHESHHPNNENKVDNDVSPERLPSSPTKINHGLNEPSSSANFSLTPQVNDMMEGKNTPLESADPKEVLNEEDDVYAEQREHIKMSMGSYDDDTDSEDDQISLESEDEIIEDMEQVAVEMKKYVELNKTVEDKETNQ